MSVATTMTPQEQALQWYLGSTPGASYPLLPLPQTLLIRIKASPVRLLSLVSPSPKTFVSISEKKILQIKNLSPFCCNDRMLFSNPFGQYKCSTYFLLNFRWMFEDKHFVFAISREYWAVVMWGGCGGAAHPDVKSKTPKAIIHIQCRPTYLLTTTMKCDC